MSEEPVSERAARHVAAFNDSVRSGDGDAFADRLAEHAARQREPADAKTEALRAPRGGPGRDRAVTSLA